MPPQALSLALFIIEEGIKNYPAIKADVQKLMTKADPTPEDWHELRAKVSEKSYRDYVPTTTLS